MAKKLLSGLVNCILVVSLLFFSYIFYCRVVTGTTPTIMGWQFATVVSGSMEPTIPVGSLIAIREQETYSPRDIIAYTREDGAMITHRLVAIGDEEAIARGDANNVCDPVISVNQIEGKVKLIVPRLGSVIQSMQAYIVPLGILAVITWFIPIFIDIKRSAAA